MRYKFSGTFRDGSGNIVSGGTVSVYASGTTTAASIYETETGTAIVNSTTTGTDGTFAFYILEGDYYGDHTRKIVLSKAGYTSKTYDYVQPTEFVNGPFTQATIEAALTAIGTVNKVTLLLRPGTWVISSNADWSAYTNVTFKIVPGAVFSTGAFTITFPAGTVAYPEWFSDADYGARINQAINSVTTNGGTVEITKSGSFATTIELTGAVVHFNGNLLTYTGTGTAVKNKIGVRPGSFTGLSLKTTADWTNVNLVGLYLTGAYKCNGTITGIDNFTTAFKLSSTAATLGSSYNTFTLGNFSTNKISLHVHMAATDGWTNENKFYGGSFSPGSAAPAGSIGIKIESTSSSASDHNVFFSPSLEHWETAISCIYAQSSMFFSPRFEGNTTDIIYNTASVRNWVIGPVNPLITDNSIVTNGSNYEIGGKLNVGGHRYQNPISAGAVSTGGYGYLSLNPETGTTDDLDTINGGRVSDILLLTSETHTNTITVKHNTGNIFATGRTDVILKANAAGQIPVLVLFYNGSKWLELCRWGSNIDKTLVWNPASLADGAGETSVDISVEAALGDFVMVAAPYDLQGITVTAYVSATDVVKIRIQNETGGVIDLASGTWRVRVVKP